MLHGEGSASPVLTHPLKSCLKEIGYSGWWFGLSFLIKGEVIAVCLVRSGQINLL